MNRRWISSRRGATLIGGVIVGVVAATGVGFAFWTVTDTTHSAVASSDSLPKGATPTVSVNGSTVTISFARAQMTVSHAEVSAYEVRRYDASDSLKATFICLWPSNTTLNCAESNVPGGTFYYTDAPTISGSNWDGSESDKSNAAVTDSIAPTTTASLNPAPNANGWDNTTVTVTLDAQDNTGGSGVAATYYTTDGSAPSTSSTLYTGPFTVSSTRTVRFYSVDNAGNQENVESQQVNVDAAAPHTTGTVSPTANADGWNNTSAQVSLTATDTGGSGVDKTYYTTDGSDPTFSITRTAYTAPFTVNATTTIKYYSTDTAGNAETPTTAVVQIDSANPNGPTISFPSDQGLYNASGWVGTISGTASDNGTSGIKNVKLFIKRNADGLYWNGTGFVSGVQTLTATGTTIWSYTFARPADGSYTVSAQAFDSAGNSSVTSSANFTVDATAPAPPSISVPSYVNLANATAVAVSGTAEAGSKISLAVTDAGSAHTKTASVTTDNTGHWATSLDLSGLNDGTLNYSATATDAAQNISSPGAASNTKDTVRPSAPVISVAQYVNSGNASSFTVGGTAEANATISVAVTDTGTGNAHPSAAPVANSSGIWTTTVNLSSLADGTLTYTATATDAAGNSGSQGSTTNAKDTSSPTVTVEQASGQVDPSKTSPLNFTATFSEPVQSFSGSAVTVGGTAGHGTVTVTKTDSAHYNLAVAVTSDGTVTASIAAGAVLDLAGNGSQASTSTDNTVTFDATAPAVTLTKVNGTAVTFPYNTKNNVVSVGGACGTANGDSTTVNVTVNGSPATPSSTTCSSGSWTLTFTTAISAEAKYSLSATQTDTAGNAGTASGSVTVDKTAPSQPTATYTDYSGNNADVISGTAEAGSTITITESTPAAHTFTGTADASGNYSLNVDTVKGRNTAQIAYSYSVTATDAAGNVSTAKTVSGNDAN